MSGSFLPAEDARIPRPLRVSRIASYSVAVASSLLVFSSVFLCEMIGLPYDLIAIFIVAVGLSAWLGGSAPALLSMALLAVPLASILFRTEPTWSAEIRCAVVVAAGGLIWIISSRRRVFAQLVVELTQLRRIVSWAPVGIILFGRKRTVQYFNAAFANMYGWSLEELRGRPLPLPEGELESWEKLEDRLRRGGSFENVPARRLRKDGSEFDVSISGTPVTDDVGIVAGMVGLAVLPDPRPELMARIELLEFILNASSDFVCIASEDHAIRSINRAGKIMAGVCAEGATDKITILDLFREEDRAKIARVMLPMAVSGETVMTPLYLQRLDTSDLVPVHGAIHALPASLEGSERRVAYIFQNISDMVRADATSHGLSVAYKTLFRAAPVAIVLVSTSGQPFDSNERFQQIFGYDAEELKRIPFAQLVYPEDLPRTRAVFLELAAGKRDGYQVEKRLCNKNGEVFWGKMTVSLVRTNDGRPSYSISMVELLDRTPEVPALPGSCTTEC